MANVFLAGQCLNLSNTNECIDVTELVAESMETKA